MIIFNVFWKEIEVKKIVRAFVYVNISYDPEAQIGYLHDLEVVALVGKSKLYHEM